MRKINLLFIYCFYIIACYAELIIKKVEMRNLKQHDVAFIFDMTVYNDPAKHKEPLDFRVRCEKCCINVPQNETTCDAVKLIGGNFGSVESAAVKVVSLMWPTVTLYNRIGHCEVSLSIYNKTGGKLQISHTIHFDTTIKKDMITDNVRGLMKGLNYSECSTCDLNPFKNCTPVDCEEKYFGSRNFFNTKTNYCDPVPDCSATDSNDIIYDYTINECVDLKRIICKEHILAMQKGEYNNNVWEPKHNVESFAISTHMMAETYEGPKTKADVINFGETSPFMGILQGFLFIVGALILYIALSCLAFCIMVFITKRSSIKDTK